MEGRSLRPYAALGIGIVSISFAAVFIRLADAPSPAVAALRMIFAAALLAPWVLRSHGLRLELAALSKREILLLILSGAFLSLHFLLWITSLSMTGVASSVVFVTTNPIFVALYTMIVFRERVSRVFWLGLSLAVIGGLILGGGDLVTGGSRWKGNMLALAGAVSLAGYFLVGSRLRKKLSLLAYIFPVYSVAALVLVLFALVARIPFRGYTWQSYMYCFLLALVCQIVGHSTFNWALKHLEATTVTIGVLGEPVGASVLAYLILGEAPLLAEVIGGAVILAGISLVLYYGGASGEQRGRIFSR